MTARSRKHAPGEPGWIYIGGYGRSGSTLLSRMLGAHPAIFSIGQLGPGRNARETCSCGAALDRCAVWSQVRSRESVEGGSAGWATLLLAVLGRPRSTDTAALRAALNEMTRISGATWIAESSGTTRKVVARPVLAASGDDNVRFIHLIRDGRAVLWSRLNAAGRRGREPKPAVQLFIMAKTVLSWNLANIGASLVARALPSSSVMTIAYEDLADEPASTLDRLWDWLRVDAMAWEDVEMKLRTPGHEVAGNRHRFGPVGPIQADMTWTSQLPRAGRILYQMLGWPSRLGSTP